MQDVLEKPPSETESRSWLWVAAWSVGIFVTIPLARTVEGWVRDAAGQATFGWAVIATVVVVTLFAARSVRAAAARPRERPGSLGWLFAVSTGFVAATTYLWRNPEEAVHFVQYGGLAVLLHRALAHRVRDAAIYPLGVLLGGLVGCLDETIQWAVPGRYWGARDIAINLFGSALAQLGIAKGVSPAYVRPGSSRRGRLLIARAAVVWILVLFFFAFNTPQRVVGYADGVPGIAFLADNESTMTEYGHLHDEAGIGVFRSRLTATELRVEDERRALEVAAVIDRYREDPDYYEFLRLYPAQREAFLHEMRVHLFRRDRYAVYAERQRGNDDAEYRKLATVAIRENRLLEAWFGRSLAASSYVLDAERRRDLEAAELPGRPYESMVSRELVTRIGEGQLLLGFAAALVAALLALRALARDPGP